MQGKYSPFPIHPDDKQGLHDLIARIRAGELHGLNVTIPYKQTVIAFLDDLTPTARTIGAVNTVFLRDGSLIGENTDAAGFLFDLKRFLAEDPSSSLSRRSSLVLGAGGSARAVVYALLHDGWRVTLSARRLEKAQQLARSFPSYQLFITDFPACQLSNFHLIVNTTPLGMMPHTEASPLPENISLSQSTIVYDLIYNPRETKLVRQAKQQGCRATNGFGMLIEQAALSFQIWTGHNPPREKLWQSLPTDVRERPPGR